MQIIENGKPIQILVHVDRDAAILAGKTHWGDHVVELNPASLTPEQRQTLTRCAVDYNRGIPKVLCQDIQIPDASLESIQMILDGIIRITHEAQVAKEAELTEKREKFLADTREFLALPDEECMVLANTNFRDTWGQWWMHSTAAHSLLYCYGLKLEDLPTYQEVQAKKGDLEATMLVRNEALAAKRAAEKAVNEAQAQRVREAQEAKAKQQAEQIHQWAKLHGTKNQRDRLAAGVLPDDEIKTEIRNGLFSVLDNRLERYKRMTVHDVCSCQDYNCDAKFEVEDAATMTAEQWEVADQIKRQHPDAKVQLRIHEGVGRDCEEHVLRYSFLVTMTAGAFEFSREYAAPAAAEQSEED